MLPYTYIYGEFWKPVPGYQGYEASNLGRLKRLSFISKRGFIHKDKIVKPKKKDRGHMILRAFAGPPPSPKHVCRHLDDDSWNNLPVNLAWGTRKQNAEDAIRNGLIGKGSPCSAKMSASMMGKNKGRKHTRKSRRNMSEAHKGKTPSAETKRRLSIAGKGNSNALGYKHSKRTKQRMAIRMLGNQYACKNKFDGEKSL